MGSPGKRGDLLATLLRKPYMSRIMNHISAETGTTVLLNVIREQKTRRKSLNRLLEFIFQYVKNIDLEQKDTKGQSIMDVVMQPNFWDQQAKARVLDYYGDLPGHTIKHPLIVCLGIAQHVSYSDLHTIKIDFDKIKSVFAKLYGYDITYATDDDKHYKTKWTIDEINIYLDRVAKTIQASQVKYDSLILFLSTRVKLVPNMESLLDEYVLASDLSMLPLVDIFRRFAAKNCPELAGKPKIIFGDYFRCDDESKIKKFKINTFSNDEFYQISAAISPHHTSASSKGTCLVRNVAKIFKSEYYENTKHDNGSKHHSSSHSKHSSKVRLNVSCHEIQQKLRKYRAAKVKQHFGSSGVAKDILFVRRDKTGIPTQSFKVDMDVLTVCLNIITFLFFCLCFGCHSFVWIRL